MKSVLHSSAMPLRGPTAVADAEVRLMKLPLKHVLGYLGHLGFWVSAVVILVMGLMLLRASVAMKVSSDRVSHTEQVLYTTNEINERLSRAESDLRGHLLSGDARYLAGYEALLVDLGKDVQKLSQLTVDNPVQQERVVLLEQLVTERIAIMKKTLALQRAGRTGAARELAASGAGRRVTESILALTAEMRQLEQSLLSRHHQAEQQNYRQTLKVLIMTVLVSLLVLVPGYIGLLLQTRARRRIESQRESFFTLALDMLCVANLDGYFKRLNPAFTQTLGWSEEELMGRPFIDFIHPDDRVATLQAVENQLRGGGEILNLRNRYRHKDGSWRVFSWRSALGADGYMYATARDVTAQQQAEADIQRLNAQLREKAAEAEAANRAKSVFLAAMSHEIRTPMNGVLGMVELLGLSQLDNEQRTVLEIVRNSSTSLLRIIDDILDFSKIEAGKLDIRPEPASLAGVIEDVFNLYTGHASSKNLLLTRSVDPDISPALRLDALRLRQILRNFVSNAIKFTDKGNVAIRAERVERRGNTEQIRIMVADTGIGISADNQQRLFQPFAQAESDTTRRYGGTGLGLAISRRLAELMGGTVKIRSEPGQGTTMILNLSLEIAEVSELPKDHLESELEALKATIGARRGAPSIEQAKAEGTLVLLADDHRTNRALLLRQMNTLGYAAEAAEDGVIALEKWRSGRFALLISDCNMPRMDGYELARRIRETESAEGLRRIPIIACTANALGSDADMCYAAGMDDYLAKPVDLTQLLAKLERWLPMPKVAAIPEHQPPPPTEDAPVDHAVLASILGGDMGSLRGLLLDFRSSNDDDVAVLQSAVQKQDLSAITNTAHRMKGAGRYIGATAFASVCERIEQAGRSGDLQAVADSLHLLEHERRRLSTYCDVL
jgi:PAS domain S-box-containing protein